MCPVDSVPERLRKWLKVAPSHEQADTPFQSRACGQATYTVLMFTNSLMP